MRRISKPQTIGKHKIPLMLKFFRRIKRKIWDESSLKKYHFKYLLGLILFPLILFQSGASQSVLSGKVVDPFGNPIIGANITLKNGQTGTATDKDGLFGLVVSLDDTLLISYLGFQNVEVAIAGRQFIDIEMIPNIELLERVVVVGYGTQKKKDITGATASVSVEDFNKGIINSPEQLIRGKVAGDSGILN
jgi:hypothetical protein